MALIGRLDLTIPDLLQILSLCMKTGKLRLSRLGDYGEIGFKKGKVIYATSSTTRNTLGEILIIQKHLNEKSLMAALELQHLSAQNKRLGAILVEKGLVTHAALQEAVQHQIELVILEFLHWDTGFFRFEMADVFTDDDIMLDAQEFLVKVGISPEHLLLEGMRHEDEQRKAEQPMPSSPEIAPRPAADVPSVSKHHQPAGDIAPTPVPEQPPAGRVKEVLEAEKPAPSGPKATPPPAPEQPFAGRIKGPRGDEKRASSAPTTTPPPAPDAPPSGWLEEGRQASKRASSMPEATRPPAPEPPAVSRVKDAPDAQKATPSRPKAPPPPAPDAPPPGRLEEGRQASKRASSMPEATRPPAPEQPAASRVKDPPDAQKPTPSRPKAPPPPAPDAPPPGRLEKARESEKRPPSIPETTVSPTSDLPPQWLEEALEDVKDVKHEASLPKATSSPTLDLPPEWLEEAIEDVKHEASPPEITRPPAPDLPAAGRLKEAPAAAKPTPSRATAPPPPASHPRPAEVPKAPPAGHDVDPVLAGGPTARTTPEAPQPELSASNIVEHVLYGLPVAPWVPIMLAAPDIVTRAVVLFAREGRISGYDQYGVYGGIEGGDARVRSISIPVNEASIFAGVLNRGTAYRGKMGPGKWNAYFLEQIGGKKPNDAVLIPIIAAGKTIGIFYGDDAGSGNSLGDIERLEALIAETFSAIELPILETQSKHPA